MGTFLKIITLVAVLAFGAVLMAQIVSPRDHKKFPIIGATYKANDDDQLIVLERGGGTWFKCDLTENGVRLPNAVWVNFNRYETITPVE